MSPRRALIDMAIAHLKCARDDLHAAGAPRAADKVRAALKSAEGAARNALCQETRDPPTPINKDIQL